MNNQCLAEYQEHVNKVKELLENNIFWISTYNNYAKAILKNENNFSVARKKFRKWKNLDFYLTIGRLANNDISFDIRYLGQKVGTLEGKDTFLCVDSKTNANNSTYFGYTLGTLKNECWHTSKKAKEFRRFFRDITDKMPRQKEHMVESALYSEMGKRFSKNKTLLGIQPIQFSNTRIHMKTVIAASEALVPKIAKPGYGGEIDLLCRRRNTSAECRLAVIEIKDENQTIESFDKTMYQALSYTVFLLSLFRSPAGKDWLKILGMASQYDKDSITIDAVVAMPKGDTVPSYCGEYLNVGNDKIQLHYIEITNYDGENTLCSDVKFISSF